MRWMLSPYRRYFKFRGRSRRTEFWPFALGFAIVLAALGLSERVLGDSRIIDPLRGLFVLGSFIPGLAVTVRRLHDASRTGWWAALPFTPVFLALILVPFDEEAGETTYQLIGLSVFLCPAILLVMLAWKGTTGPNRFGADPRNPAAGLEAVFG
ncbi:MAG TPA: DUF805 domain-containing protein [Sphingomonas sp.]|nr:DUF805 domain-containing protein [Sphingomonas sp.]